MGAELITKRTHARGRRSGGERVKGKIEKDKGLRGLCENHAREKGNDGEVNKPTIKIHDSSALDAADPYPGSDQSRG